MNDQPTERLRKPAPQLADYPHRVAEIVRFGDLDPQGHVNQAVFLTYFESGRVAMFRNPDLGIGVPFQSVSGVAGAGALHVIYGDNTTFIPGLRATGSQFWTQDSEGIEGVAEAGDQFGRTIY